MGSKSQAKALMQKAGVPVVPGYHGDSDDPARLAAEAKKIGYPVLIKASAGGGGRGMRRVDEPSAFTESVEACRREAEAAFGDGHLLIEKWIERPRHVEVQVFADTHGNIVHVFERDCSLQRRHQKVIEEAPAPHLAPGLRAAMTAAAVEAARAVGYAGAGTVEFILAPDGRFYFMEMNTRLQVEHPVTEMVTGLDLVEWQFRVAAGEALPLPQDRIVCRGHAIEARIYAEDPARGFLPAPGRIAHLRFPFENEALRIDSAVDQGDEVTPHYDAMIAKLIVWQTSREQAVVALTRALGEVQIAGPISNVQFLRRLTELSAFARADLDTGLIARHLDELVKLRPVSEKSLAIIAIAELLGEPDASVRRPWAAADSFRLNGIGRRSLTLAEGDRASEVTLTREGQGWRVDAGGRTLFMFASLENRTPALDLRVSIDGHTSRAVVVADGTQRHLFWMGEELRVEVKPLLPLPLAASAGESSLRAPMPGRIVKLMAASGGKVSRGAPLLAMEAMKMEHVITAPADGTVKAFPHGLGEQVEAGALLVDFESSTS